MTLPQMRAWTKRVAKQYGVPPVRVETEEMSQWAAHYWDGVITVSRTGSSGKTLATLTHEMAHHIHWTFLDGPVEPYHGAAFMTCYMHLLDVTRCIPAPAMKTIAAQYKVAYIDLPKWDCRKVLATAVQKAHA